MSLFRLVLREISSRRVQSTASLITIAMATALVVAVISVMHSYRLKISAEVGRMGPSLIVIPEDLEEADYFMGRFGNSGFPMDYANRITGLAGDEGIRVEPRLVQESRLYGKKVVFAGVPDSSRFAPASPHAVVVGYQTAKDLDLRPGGRLDLMDDDFTVERTLAEEGASEADVTLYFKIGVLQKLLKRGTLVNQILITGNSSKALDRLKRSIAGELRGAKVITRRKILEAREKTSRTVSIYALTLSLIALLMGVIAVANQIAGNIRERRREIAIFIAMGANVGTIKRGFFQKAAMLGCAGSILGYFIGTLMGYFLSSSLAGLSMQPLFILFPVSMASVTLLIVFVSYFPIRLIAGLSPADVLMRTDA
jgi:ABC-type antimicrobial peptide transport system permease subunit